MSARPPAEHWDEVYRAKSDAEVSWYQQDLEPSLRLLLAADPQPSSAIDIGGGRSRLAAALLAAGCPDLTVLDVSAEALGQGTADFGAGVVTPIVADVRTWQPDRPRAVWHDRAVFHFLVEPEGRDAYLRAAAAGTAPGGTLVLGTFAADGPEQCSGLPTARYTTDELARMFAADFELEHAEQHTHTTPWGALQQFSWVVLRRRS